MTTKNITGMTLTELLVASMLIGIVMIGVTAFSVTINELSSTTNKGSLMAMRLEATMAQLSGDANLAIGDGPITGAAAGTSNQGVFDATGNGINLSTVRPVRSVCFRQDVDLTGNPNVDPISGKPGTPSNYADDHWRCYVHDYLNPQSKFTLWRCNILGTSGTTMPSIGGCDPANATALMDILGGNASTAFFELICDGVDCQSSASKRLQHIDFYLNAYYNNNKPFSPMSNPAYAVHTRVSPLGLSR